MISIASNLYMPFDNNKLLFRNISIKKTFKIRRKKNKERSVWYKMFIALVFVITKYK